MNPKVEGVSMPTSEAAEKCSKCGLPLNGDHAHRTYEEHDACRNQGEAPERFVKQKYPSARLIGPSGDGCHVEINGKWFAYGNIAENAWKAAATKICTECGHTIESHVEKWGGICVGCPCSGFKLYTEFSEATDESRT